MPPSVGGTIVSRDVDVLIAVGLMSGTSVDGVNAAAVAERTVDGRRRYRLIAHRHTPFGRELRDAVLQAASGALLSAEAIGALHSALGEIYADSAATLIAGLSGKPAVVGMHGQTVAHHPSRGITLQLGDASRVALRTGIPTVNDFRTADVSAGGEGAPLTPFSDHALFADGTPRVVLNLGGIANLTLLPTASSADVLGFDSGPANMLVDALAWRAGELLDRDGAGARRGRPMPGALERALAHPFFAHRAPKSTGREEFGRDFADGLLADVEREGGTLDDALATATALTARSVAEALRRETPRGVKWTECLVAGGGALNPVLLERLREALSPVPVRTTDEVGVPVQAREAMAFAILALARLRGEPNTLPRCTGASRAVSAGALHQP